MIYIVYEQIPATKTRFNQYVANLVEVGMVEASYSGEAFTKARREYGIQWPIVECVNGYDEEGVLKND